MSNVSKKLKGTREWSEKSANATVGCSNGCVYCYARDAYERRNKSGEPWTKERPLSGIFDKKWKKIEGRYMFPTQHDITPGNYKESIHVLRELLKMGNKVLVVSKPSEIVVSRLIEDLAPYKDQVEFRFTIGSAHSDILEYWEPFAPSFEDRLFALKTAYSKGWKTSISMEPLLDNTAAGAVSLVERLSPYVTEEIWIGSLNYPEKRIKKEKDRYMEEFLKRNSDFSEVFEALKDHSLVKWKEGAPIRSEAK